MHGEGGGFIIACMCGHLWGARGHGDPGVVVYALTGPLKVQVPGATCKCNEVQS